MSDWFKYYETDLADERLQWAMAEQQQTCVVYLAILSRCCRDKSGTLSWKDENFELPVIANQVHISMPIANQALRLLEKIGFIEFENGTLKVLRWNERQSEYCQRKKVKSGPTPDSVGTLSGQSSTLSVQRRGEERREEEKEKRPEASLLEFDRKDTLPSKLPTHLKPKVAYPSLEEMKLIGAKAGISEQDCVILWNKWEESDWKVKGKPIKSVSRTLVVWKGYGYLPSQQRNGNGTQSQSVFSLKASLEAKEKIAEDLKRKYSSQVADGTTWSDPAKRQEYVALRTEVRDLNARIAASA